MDKHFLPFKFKKIVSKAHIIMCPECSRLPVAIEMVSTSVPRSIIPLWVKKEVVVSTSLGSHSRAQVTDQELVLLFHHLLQVLAWVNMDILQCRLSLTQHYLLPGLYPRKEQGLKKSKFSCALTLPVIIPTKCSIISGK